MTAWHRKALEGPAPWAVAMRPAERETLVAFYRVTPEDDGFGGFTDGATVPVSIACHVEMQRDPGTVQDSLRGRRWVIYVPLPLDADLVPRTGDRVAFLDRLGRPVDMAVRENPWLADGLSDHLVVKTEDIE